MPLIDLTLPRDALCDDAAAELMETLTRTLPKWERAEPGERRGRVDPWTFPHEPALVTVTGRPVQRPRQRIMVGVPQATLDEDAFRVIGDHQRELGQRRPHLPAARHPRLRRRK
ncbi:hypothetical protein ACH35V_18985 [Actinomadura sp. 1N219]|uniref:hypothetical protein n=1 Tax=Actinomadura sp. 1N219 TaxID=3375152 RepID=UPI00379281E6